MAKKKKFEVKMTTKPKMWEVEAIVTEQRRMTILMESFDAPTPKDVHDALRNDEVADVLDEETLDILEVNPDDFEVDLADADE